MEEQPSQPDPTHRSPSPRQHSVPTERPGTRHHTGSDADAGSSVFADVRFTPGTLLAARYRIVGRLGKGGMGEVYRADDLKLGQAVALKFLPEGFARDPKWLRRFTDEVRIARDVAHPNVCRTYDIVEADGEHFITMEFVDGEDLSSLLRRIGRLPQDKAIEIARQLCAGLAAAHDKSVLHRDLKPPNVMLDGRGRVRITDFGIAALAEEMHGKDARSGTPAYMAPEQLAGEGASVRSDIYSLGLVLYEVFTGKEAFHAESISDLQKMRKSGTFTTPSSIVMDLDPLVERVIMRCLANEPRERPSSAIAVAAALPGGDPLAMALAAGETPSPEMVAHGGGSGGLRPAIAASLFGALALMLALSIWVMDRISILTLVSLEKTPQAILDRAREMLHRLGYADKPSDEALWIDTDFEYLSHIEETDQSSDRWKKLASGRPRALYFSYRTGPMSMMPVSSRGRVWLDDPPFTFPGMTRMALDPKGRLVGFTAVPPALAEKHSTDENTAAAPGDSHPPDWSLLFAAAEIDPGTLKPAELQRTPPVFCDAQSAWIGVWPGSADLPLRVEAGAFQGKPVYFAMFGSWNKPPSTIPSTPAGDKAAQWSFLILIGGVTAIGILMAVRNLRAGRGDRRGAARLTVYVLIISLFEWLFTAHQPLSMEGIFTLLQAFQNAAGYGLLCWLFYMAVEPYARRYWPHALISWSRLIAGNLRDPMVGRDLLLGCLAGASLFLIERTSPLVMPLLGQPPPLPPYLSTDALLGSRYVIGQIFSAQGGVGAFIGFFILLLILRIVLRKPWLAVTSMVLLSVVIFTGFFSAPIEQWINGLAVVSILLFVLIRFGLLALLTTALASGLMWGFPTTFDFSKWYAGIGLCGPLLVLGLAGYGFWVALAGQPLFRDELAVR